MSKGIPSPIKYTKVKYNSNRGFAKVNLAANDREFKQLLADSLLSCYSSSKDPKHKLIDGIYLDSIPSHIRHDKDELNLLAFKCKKLISSDSEDQSFLQPYIYTPSNIDDYFNTLLAQSYTSHNILVKGLTKFLNLKGFIVHYSSETDPLEERDLGYFNKVTFHRIEVDRASLKQILYSQVEKNIGKIKGILEGSKKIGEQYIYKIYCNDFPIFLFALKCLDLEATDYSTKLYNSNDIVLGDEFHSVLVDSTKIESLNAFLDNIPPLTSEVTINGGHIESPDFN